VIDPFAPARGRGRPQRLAELAAGDAGDPAAALAGLAAAAPHGVDLGRFAVARALKDGALAEIVDRLGLRAVGSGAARLGLAPSRWARLEERALARLGAPGAGESAGVGVGALARAIGAPDGLAAAVLAALKERGLAETGGGKARLKGARPGLGPADGALWDKVRAELAAHALRPPSVAVLAEAVGGKAKGVEAMLGRAQALGLVFRIARNRFILAETLRALAEIAEALAAEGDGTFTAAAFRDRAGIGRNVSIEVIELFDRMRFTRRKGEARAILTPLGAVKWGGDG
jgi:selenocysteine-specific elongation factor